MPRETPRTPAAPTGTDAKNYVASPSGAASTDDLEVGQQAERVMRSSGPARESLDKQSLIQVTDQPLDSDYVAMIAFMNETIEIKIHETTDENAEQVFEININGRPEFFRRGETKTVLRYYVDRMLRMKETKYRQRETFENGERTMRQVPVTAVKYPFSVTDDKNPLGKSWLKAVAAEIG